MAKPRVHELAKEFGVESKFVLEKLKEMGEFVKSASSTVEPPVAMKFKKEYGEQLKAAADAAPAPEKKAPAQARPQARPEGRAAARSRRDDGGGAGHRCAHPGSDRRAAGLAAGSPVEAPAASLSSRDLGRRGPAPVASRPQARPEAGRQGRADRARGSGDGAPAAAKARPRVPWAVPALRVRATTRSRPTRAWAVGPLPRTAVRQPLPALRAAPAVPVATSVRRVRRPAVTVALRVAPACRDPTRR